MSARRFGSKSRGAAAIEFALIVTPFCVMLFGMIDYGWWFFVDLLATNAVREGARAATTRPAGAACLTGALGTTAGTDAIDTYFTGVLPAYPPTRSCTCTVLPSGDPSFQCTVQVDFTPITGLSLVPMPPGGGGGKTRVLTSATMRGVP